MVERRNRQARLTDAAWRGWDRILVEHGMTWTVLIEILGQLSDEGLDWLPPEAVQRARELDLARYSRRPTRDEPD
jgi:hypothetical protein